MAFTSADIDRLHDELEEAKDCYLREKGWDEHGDVPGACYLWTRTLPDHRVVWLDRDLAVLVQQALDAEEGKPC